MGNIFDFFNYNKPGPGVPKDEPPKPRIVVFFQIYFDKFWDLMKLNLMFSFFNIPALILVYFLFSLFFSSVKSSLTEDGTFFSLVLFTSISSVFLSVPVITTGPSQAGFTFVLRNFSRREHVFLMSDFKENIGKNFKQALAICMIDFFVVLFLLVDIYICINSGMDRLLAYLMIYIIIFVLILFLMMHLYIYPMLVTFELSIKHIYKNALIFAIAKFIPNLGILLLCFAISALPFLIYLPAAILLFPIITLSTVGFITNFYAFPTLEKYMIKKE
ncbi:DUF624 domain-containing protein [Acetivibrio clariflavus]|uniref:Putative integral membrane protein n=1 Tax=Acetivibrio clariflavus (strain DSM 19732 / NBRC 101661 / EBR45) TaxID=720554 RepID=G8LWX1_ACECE|nr:DUF624 domain-containing protein [Acetivibrio clariflavus]AEV67623.1 putative integral membrane protein [Acetivibrio clariflavus DSM 19732]